MTTTHPNDPFILGSDDGFPMTEQPTRQLTGQRTAAEQHPTVPIWTSLDTLAVVLLSLLALVPRTVNLLGLDPFVDEAAWTDWALRQFEIAAPRTWFIPLLTDG